MPTLPHNITHHNPKNPTTAHPGRVILRSVLDGSPNALPRQMVMPMTTGGGIISIICTAANRVS